MLARIVRGPVGGGRLSHFCSDAGRKHPADAADRFMELAENSSAAQALPVQDVGEHLTA